MSKRATFPKETSALVFLTLSSILAEAHDEVRVSEPILIEDPQNRSTRAQDINNRGVVVGGVATGPFTSVAFSWSQRTGIIELPVAMENGSAFATAINDCGEIVGAADFPGGFRHAARWTRDGELEDLGALSDSVSSAATDINELGAVTGVSETGEDDDVFGPIVHAFLWTEADGMRDLGTLSGRDRDFSVARAMNNRNQVVGASVPPPGGRDPHGFFWSERTGMIDLPGPDIGQGGDESDAYDINDRGVVVGIGEINGLGDFAGFTWTRQRGFRLLADPGGEGFGWPMGISRDGLIVGVSAEFGPRRALLWVRPNKVVNLSPDLGVESRAAAINDKGRIAGTVTFIGGGNLPLERAAVWRIDRHFFDPPDPKTINRLCKRPRH
jgi:probable HAF family extracellular repeat protein